MSRLHTAYSVLYDESIIAFRREGKYGFWDREGESASFIMTSFEIKEHWDLGICTVSPSKINRLNASHIAFISKIQNPKWVGKHNSHLFGIALSAIFSFISLTKSNSTKNDYICNKEKIDESELIELSLFNPIYVGGPGSEMIRISNDRQAKICVEIKEFIELLQSVEYKKYLQIMQSIRMIQLSLNNLKEDYALAYQLIVSSIESIAQIAIKKKIFKTKEPLEDIWIEKSRNDTDFKKLYELMKDYRSRNSFLAKRYLTFIKEFASPKIWEDIVLHPRQLEKEIRMEENPELDFDAMTEQRWDETYPKDLTEEEIEQILLDTYKHRSNFVHRGEQPPHKDPNPIIARFFQDFCVLKDSTEINVLLPNYQLLSAIARHSILDWAYKNN